MRRVIGVVAGVTLILGSILGLVPIAVSGAATAGTINLFAGTGGAGSTGNGGLATAADVQ